MTPINPSCRCRFTPADLEFMAQSLGQQGGEHWFADLVRDPDCLDRMLDDVRLARSVLELRGCVKISLSLYFYVLVRKTLREADVDDAEVADYLAARLSEFVSAGRVHNPWADAGNSYDYLFDLWNDAEHAEGERRFRLQMHLGDYALFLSGLFPKHLQHRVERRAAPGIEYYEQMGSASYRLAGENGMAQRAGMVSLLFTLCQAFHTTRLALNQMAEKLVFLDQNPAVERLIRDVDQSS